MTGPMKNTAMASWANAVIQLATRAAMKSRRTIRRVRSAASQILGSHGSSMWLASFARSSSMSPGCMNCSWPSHSLNSGGPQPVDKKAGNSYANFHAALANRDFAPGARLC